MAGYRKPFVYGAYSPRSLNEREREEERAMLEDEDRESAAADAKEQAAIADLRIALAAAACEAAAIEKLVENRFRFAELVEERVIRFTDPIKGQKVRGAFAAFDAALRS